MAAFFRDSQRVGFAQFARFARAIGFAAVVALLLAGAPTRAVHAGTLVSFNFTNFGSVQIDLFDDLVSTTVDNFVDNYVQTDRYDNSMIHRSVSNFVIQGGGFHPDGSAIPTSSPIPLQYSRANTRGTIAMARTNVLNSATGQWFINTGNNTTILGQANNGGYAVFGWVVGPGMNVVDAIAAVQKFDYNGPNNAIIQASMDASAQQWGLQNRHTFNEWPLQNFSAADYNNGSGSNPIPHAIVLSSATVVKTHPSYQNPYAVLDVNNDAALTATDARDVISELLAHGSHDLTSAFAGASYVDTDGNGRVNATDARNVITAVLSGTPLQTSSLVAQPMTSAAAPQAMAMAASQMMGMAEPEAMAMASSDGMMLLVPEPSSLTLVAMFTLALGGYFVLRLRAWRCRPANRAV
jgi:cyclophilin family peptidyl-prolyl cis-trans isomerase